MKKIKLAVLSIFLSLVIQYLIYLVIAVKDAIERYFEGGLCKLGLQGLFGTEYTNYCELAYYYGRPFESLYWLNVLLVGMPTLLIASVVFTILYNRNKSKALK